VQLEKGDQVRVELKNDTGTVWAVSQPGFQDPVTLVTEQVPSRYCMKNKGCHFLCALLIVMAFAASCADAEEPSPSCYVSCDLSRLSELGSKTKILQDQTSEVIAERLKLKENFPYWIFQPGDGTSYPFLRVSVVD
jgi:hypothetical protein